MAALDLRINQNPEDYLTPEAIRAAWLDYRKQCAEYRTAGMGYGQWLAGYRETIEAGCNAFSEVQHGR